MDIELLRQNWAPLVAAALLIPVAGIVIRSVARRSSRGQLRQAHKTLREAERKRARSEKAAAGLERKLAGLAARVESVKPRHVEGVKGALSDANALAKIADDQVLIAANQLRRIIYEEFPPSQHARLREKYLPGDGPDDRPFSF